MKKKRWVKPRHAVARNVLSFLIGPFCRARYRAKVEKFKAQAKRPYLILYNHQTPFDQFFVGMAFRGPIYYVATEDIFSLGFASSIIKYLVAPIPIQKSTTDVRAVMNCIRVAREGGSIAIAPEGNRTYSGRTGDMLETIAPLARKLGMPIALYRLEGGYGVHPRWSDVVRKGGMRGYVSRVIEPEEYAEMSDELLFDAIKTELYVDEAVLSGEFKHKRRAEYLERAFYSCPFCGLSELESDKSTVMCKRCGRKVSYGADKRLSGVGFDFPYEFVADWYDAQSKLMNSLDPLSYKDAPIFRDSAALYSVIPMKRKDMISKDTKIALYGDRIEIDKEDGLTVFKFDDITSVAVLGRNKLGLYHGGCSYQIKGGKRFNALKYVHLYHRYTNVMKGEKNVEFLGL